MIPTNPFSTRPLYSNQLPGKSDEIDFSSANQSTDVQNFNPDLIQLIDNNLDNSTSLDLCALKMSNIMPSQASFFTQSEIDADDVEQKRMLEELFGQNFRNEFQERRNEEGLINPLLEFLPQTCLQRLEESYLEMKQQQQQQQQATMNQNLFQAFEEYIEKMKLKTENKPLQPSSNLNFDWIFQGMQAGGTKEELISPSYIQYEGVSPDLQKQEQNTQLFQGNVSVSKSDEKEQVVQFNVMVVGKSGVGKSAFTDYFLEREYNVKSNQQTPTQEFNVKEGVRKYSDLTFKMCFVDTPGYDYETDINRWYQNIENYITKQFEDYKFERNAIRQGMRKRKAKDKRVHMILYFTSGSRIEQNDFCFMKRLKQFSNIVPILARGDAYTTEEVKSMKTLFLDEVKRWNLELFNFTEALKDEENKLKSLKKGKLGPCPPFLISSSTKKIQIGPDQYVYGREYPWGIYNVEDPNHSDFSLLKSVMGGYIFIEAKTLTDEYYKQYFQNKKLKRKQQIQEENKKNVGLGAAFTLGVFGAFMIAKQKLLSN